MRRRFSIRGQALVMVTIGLIGMFGVIGLAVDFGWMFFVRKNARSAADAAALAAVKRAFSTVSAAGPFTCSADPTCPAGSPCLICQTATACSGTVAGSNLKNGCLYAESHGFTESEVKMAGGVTSPFQTGTGEVAVHYWVTATVTRVVPQLFSAVLGNPTGTVSARASAAILQATVDSSFIILNRRKDRARPGGNDYYGANMILDGGAGTGAVLDQGRISMASDCNTYVGAYECSAGFAGAAKPGSGIVDAKDGIEVFGNGDLEGGAAHWNPYPPDHTANAVKDPLAGRGQPPVPGTWGPPVAVKNGLISATARDQANNLICPGGDCPPGLYYAVDAKWVATGNQLEFEGDITMKKGATGFGNYIFYGGIMGRPSGATVTFEPGRYVFAGAKSGTPLIQGSNNFSLKDNTPGFGENSDAGVLFILTNGTYSGNPSVNAAAPDPTLRNLKYSSVDIKGGESSTPMNLHGLNPDYLKDVEPALNDWIRGAGLLFWQDQQNSLVKYGDDPGDPAHYSIPAGGEGPGDFDYVPNVPDPANLSSPQLTLEASANMHFYGIIYQPRGAWTSLTAGGLDQGHLQLITGAFGMMSGGARLSLGVPINNPVTITTVALIQ